MTLESNQHLSALTVLQQLNDDDGYVVVAGVVLVQLRGETVLFWRQSRVYVFSVPHDVYLLFCSITCHKKSEAEVSLWLLHLMYYV